MPAPLVWGTPNERYYEHGIDRGVAYPPGALAVPWNGITGFEEGGDPGEVTIMYRDGRIYNAEREASDFTGTLTAISYPEAVGKCLGMPKAANGFYVDNQKPRRFNFCYRSLVGSGGLGDLYGYQIHLVYNAVASINPRGRRTLNENVEILEMTFDMICTPVQLAGFRPAAHYILDTRGLAPAKLTALENMLYGTASVNAYMPTPTQIKATIG